MESVKIIYNGVELTKTEFSIEIASANANGLLTIAINRPEPIQEHPLQTRLDNQLEALRWLQGRTSDQFVLAWIAMEIQSVERAGGTPERS